MANETVETVNPATGELVVTSADVQGAVESLIAGMNAGDKTIYSAVEAVTWEDKTAVFSAITNSEPVDENAGKTINLVNFIAQTVQIVDSATNQEITVPRVVLIDADGTSYHAISGPVLIALNNIVQVFGRPGTWPSSLPIVITKEAGKRGKFFKLAIVQASKK